MTETETVRLALNALAIATGADYRAAVAELHAASDALLLVIRAREAWLDRAEDWLRANPDDARHNANSGKYVRKLHEQEQMMRLYEESYRAVTAYAVVVEEPPRVSVAEMAAVAQSKMEGV